MEDTGRIDEQVMARFREKLRSTGRINPELYKKYEVKRGLRDIDGRGVLVGLTEIGEVHSYILDEEELIPVPGRLIYRGVDIFDIVNGFTQDGRFGFEETCFLLLFGDLPNREELRDFEQIMGKYRRLSENFVSDMILKMPSQDIMNSMARSVLALYSMDSEADNTNLENVLIQCLRLIACFPLIAVYSYNAYCHYFQGASLHIHAPRADLGTAENILHMLRADSKYTQLEAQLLDLALVLHAEHGGGNNSSFVTHVVTSSGSDTYSVIAAALGSLKGPRHGGANFKVVQMFEDMKEKIQDWEDEEKIEEYLGKLLDREAFDQSGLIYGMGHAVYSISDPRSVLFKEHVEILAREKGMEDEFGLYDKVERLAPKVIAEKRKIYKGVSANVDFYSGFAYRMLGIPPELYTPIFAISRIVGWSAHRMEELINAGKIIRPGYKSVAPRRAYIGMDERNQK